MKRVTGIGGIFFKAKDPVKIQDWYARHLGVAAGADGAVSFEWREKDSPGRVGRTVWSAFPADTDYFRPSESPFMINYRVEDLKGLLEQLRSEGVRIEGEIQEYEYGRFAWVMDPEGNRIELWEPAGEPGQGSVEKPPPGTSSS